MLKALLLVSLLVVLLHVFLVRIALFAGLAVFMRGDAALMRAFLAFGLGLFAAGSFLLLRGESRAGQQTDDTGDRTQTFDELHIFTLR